MPSNIVRLFLGRSRCVDSIKSYLDLHPLALEDVFHEHSGNRSKADYYTQHLFLRVLAHELVEDDQIPFVGSGTVTDGPRTSSPEPISYFSPEDGATLADSGELKKNEGVSTSFSSISKRQVSRRSPILPTTRNDARPIYNRGPHHKEFTTMAAKEAAVSTILFPFFLLDIIDGSIFVSCKRKVWSARRTRPPSGP